MANSHDSTEPVAWAMPKGDGTFIDVITPAEHAREEGSYTVPLFAHPVAQQPQAEAVPVVDRVYEAAKRLVDHADFQLGGVLSAKSKARDIPSNAASKVKARHLASLRDALAKAPQQAEAVPSDVVRDAERYRWLRNESWAGYNTGKGTPSVYTVDGAGNRRMMLAEEAMDEAIDAAIAQQKGGEA